MSASRYAKGTHCPWCHEGEIVVHQPGEEWWVIEDGDEAAQTYSGRFPAGIRRKRFKTPPVEWFSCTSCKITGTTSYLSSIIARHAAQRLGDFYCSPSSAAVKRGTLSGLAG